MVDVVRAEQPSNWCSAFIVAPKCAAGKYELPWLHRCGKSETPEVRVGSASL